MCDIDNPPVISQSSTINPGVIHHDPSVGFFCFHTTWDSKSSTGTQEKVRPDTTLARLLLIQSAPAGGVSTGQTPRHGKTLKGLAQLTVATGNNSNYFMISKEINIASSWWLPQIYRFNVKNVRSWALEPLAHLRGACGFPANKLLHRSINHR